MGRGKYPLIGAVQGYINYLKTQIDEGVADGEIDLRTERALLAKAQREKIELEMAERAGQLLPLQSVIDVGAGLVSAIRSRFLSVHHSIKQKYSYVDPAIIEHIKLLHTEALEDLSKGDIAADVLKSISNRHAS